MSRPVRSADRAPPLATVQSFTDALTGLSADRSIRGRARWLLDLLEQVPPVRVPAVVQRAAADLREAVGRPKLGP